MLHTIWVLVALWGVYRIIARVVARAETDRLEALRDIEMRDRPFTRAYERVSGHRVDEP